MDEQLGTAPEATAESKNTQKKPLEEINADQLAKQMKQAELELQEAEADIYEQLIDFQDRQADADFGLLYEKLFPDGETPSDPALVLEFADYIGDADVIPENLGDPILSPEGAQEFNRLLEQGKAEKVAETFIANINAFTKLTDKLGAPKHIVEAARAAALNLTSLTVDTELFGGNEKGFLRGNGEILATWRVGEVETEENNVEEQTIVLGPTNEESLEQKKILEKYIEETLELDPEDCLFKVREQLSIMNTSAIETGEDAVHEYEKTMVEGLSDGEVLDFLEDTFLDRVLEQNEDLLKFMSRFG